MQPALNDARAPRSTDLDAGPDDEGGRASDPLSRDDPPSRWTSLGMVVATVGAVVGVVLRWWPRSVLWLDEAQSVAFASLPLQDIPHALREDGAPPAYYLLLHVWMDVTGDSDTAVRALSAILSMVTLLVAVLVVRRRWGAAAAFAAFVLLATSPFAIRYATHARMYSLVMLEAVVGIAAVDRALQRPQWRRLVAVSLLAAALLYTHYWGVYLVGATAAVLWMSSLAAPAATDVRRGRRRVALAVLTGFVLWAPWVPTFLFQSRHTATPWAAPAHFATALQVFASTAAGPGIVAALLGVVVAVCFLTALRSARTGGAGRISIGAVGTVAVLTALGGVAGAIVSSSAASSRYLAVAVPLVAVTAGVGAARLRISWRAGILAVAAVLGVWLGRQETVLPRTTAADVAAVIEEQAEPGDRVVYCPDQLGPAMHRLLEQADVDVDEMVFPPGSAAGRVDWIDYSERAEWADPDELATRLVGTGDTIWLVVSRTYPPTERACDGLIRALQSSPLSSRLLLRDRHDLIEHGALWRFSPQGA